MCLISPSFSMKVFILKAIIRVFALCVCIGFIKTDAGVILVTRDAHYQLTEDLVKAKEMWADNPKNQHYLAYRAAAAGIKALNDGNSGLFEAVWLAKALLLVDKSRTEEIKSMVRETINAAERIEDTDAAKWFWSEVAVQVDVHHPKDQ